jgi:hypothetical protein
MSVRNIVGNVPEPDELYGRDDLIAHLWRQLAGNNMLILGPRRFGKSGIMRHLLQRPKEGFIPVSMDLMDADSPAEFVLRLTEAVLEQDRLRAVLHKARGIPTVLKRLIADTFEAVEYEGIKLELRKSIEGNWRDTARRLVLELEKADDTILFLLDEFPVMMATMGVKHGQGTAQDFMAWFSSFRLQSKDVLRRHRFVIAGSIGIDSILRRIDPPDKLRDFERLPVGGIAEEDALRLVNDLAASLDLDIPADLGTASLDLIGPRVPFFIHLLFSQLAQLQPKERHPITRLALDRVYLDKVLGPTCKSRFDHYRDRLQRYGRPLERAAMAVLRMIADAPSGRVPVSGLFDSYRKSRGRGANQTEFDELLADLECDWYVCLAPQTNEYYFMVSVMRDWWRRWYGSARRGAVAKGGR